MTITTLVINDIQDAEQEALDAAVQRATRLSSAVSDSSAEIFVVPRRADGWLEYIVHCKREDGTVWGVVGVIQRFNGAEFEFHS